LAGAALPLASRAESETEVDLALVLAVDVSRSMDEDEQRLQRDGYVEGFRSPIVHEAIRKGVLGRVAVVYMKWSGSDALRLALIGHRPLKRTMGRRGRPHAVS